MPHSPTSRYWPITAASTSAPPSPDPGPWTSPAPTSGPSSTSTCAANRKPCWTSRHHATPRSPSLPRTERIAHQPGNELAAALSVASPGRAAVSVPVIHDVDDVAVGCPHEEPAHAPCLGSYRFHDLVAEFLRFLIGSFDVVGVDGNDRIFGRGCVARYQLDVRSGVGRGVAGHPSHVELLGTQPEVAGVEALRCLDVSHREVGHNAYDAHAILLPRISDLGNRPALAAGPLPVVSPGGGPGSRLGRGDVRISAGPAREPGPGQRGKTEHGGVRRCRDRRLAGDAGGLR